MSKFKVGDVVRLRPGLPEGMLIEIQNYFADMGLTAQSFSGTVISVDDNGVSVQPAGRQAYIYLYNKEICTGPKTIRITQEDAEYAKLTR